MEVSSSGYVERWKYFLLTNTEEKKLLYLFGMHVRGKNEETLNSRWKGNTENSLQYWATCTHFCVHWCSEQLWNFRAQFANQSKQKALFAGLVYTNTKYLSTKSEVCMGEYQTEVLLYFSVSTTSGKSRSLGTQVSTIRWRRLNFVDSFRILFEFCARPKVDIYMYHKDQMFKVDK